MSFRYDIIVLSVFLTVSAALTPVVGYEANLAEVKELFEGQDYDAARRALEGLPEEDGNRGEALYYLGRLDLIDGNHDAASENFERAIDAEPDQSDYHYWHAFAMMRKMPYRSFLGRMMNGMNMVKEFRKAVELDPENLRARMTLFQIMARSYAMGGSEKQDLIEEVESIAEIDSIMGRVARGTFYQEVELDTDRAGAEFEMALGLAPDNRAAVVSYADYLWETDRRDEAIQILASFVERAPDDKPSRFSLGIKTILLGDDYADAESLFEACLRLKTDTGMPSETMVRWCLGLACRLQGKEDRAQEEWSAVYEIDKRFDDVLEETPDLAELNAILKREK